MKQIIIQDQTGEIAEALLRIEKRLAHIPDFSKYKPSFVPISKKQLKEEFGVSYSSQFKWEKEGIIKKYGLGGRVFFNRIELENALIELS